MKRVSAHRKVEVVHSQDARTQGVESFSLPFDKVVNAYAYSLQHKVAAIRFRALCRMLFSEMRSNKLSLTVLEITVLCPFVP